MEAMEHKTLQHDFVWTASGLQAPGTAQASPAAR